jgi:glycyl-tRNA synthetase
MKFSGHNFTYRDEASGESFIPWVIETSAGADRATLAFLCDAYTEIEGGRTTTTESNKEMEVVLRLHSALAPVKVAVLPLAKKPELTKVAEDLLAKLRPHFMTAYDEVSSIGRRYRRQDEIGTPYCVTIDFETLQDKAVTIRDRDTMKQERISLQEVAKYLQDKLVL